MFATVGAVACVTIKSTFSRTNSAAISKGSLRPSPSRYSIAMLRPSIQPSSRALERMPQPIVRRFRGLAVINVLPFVSTDGGGFSGWDVIVADVKNLSDVRQRERLASAQKVLR